MSKQNFISATFLFATIAIQASSPKHSPFDWKCNNLSPVLLADYVTQVESTPTRKLQVSPLALPESTTAPLSSSKDERATSVVDHGLQLSFSVPPAIKILPGATASYLQAARRGQENLGAQTSPSHPRRSSVTSPAPVTMVRTAQESSSDDESATSSQDQTPRAKADRRSPSNEGDLNSNWETLLREQDHHSTRRNS